MPSPAQILADALAQTSPRSLIRVLTGAGTSAASGLPAETLPRCPAGVGARGGREAP